MVPVGARLTDWWTFSLLGILFHTTRSSFEYWGAWTDGDSDLSTLPTIRFLALLKTCWLLFGNHPSYNSDQFYWSLNFLTSALSKFLYLGLCFSQQSIIYHQLHYDTIWSLSLDSNLNIFPSQERASATATIWNWGDLKSFVIFIRPTYFE